MTQKLDTITTQGFTREAVEAISHALGEPQWARERRREAWQVYENTPMPARTDEAWRRTDLSALRLDAIAAYLPAAGLPQQTQDHLEALGARAGLVAQANSQPAAAELAEEWRRQGVVFTSLEQALRERPELVEPYLLAQGVLPTYSKFAALNGAFWSGGSFLHVPAGVTIPTPLVSARWLAAEGGGILPRTIIVLEPGSSVTYLDDSASAGHGGMALACGVTDIFLMEGAQLRYLALQDWGQELWDFSMVRASLGRNSVFRPVLASFGGRVSRVHLEAAMEGPGAEALLRGIYFGAASQHFEFRTLQDHAAPSGVSDLLFKGALKHRASAAYEGVVKVRKGAIRTSANQANRNLLLDRGAKADSVPVLEIEASDINRCSHGATVGQVDEEQLFYLMSRGLSRSAAEELIVTGFFEAIICEVPLPGLQDRLRARVSAKLAQPAPGAAS